MLSLSCAAFLVCGSQANAQNFDEPPDDSGGGSDATVVDLAISAYDAQVEEHCECNPDATTAFERCTEKGRKKAFTAFKGAAKYNQESVQDLKSALADEADLLNSDCADQSGDDGSGGDDDTGPGDDFGNDPPN